MKCSKVMHYARVSLLAVSVQTTPKDPLRWCGNKSTVPEIYHCDEQPRCIQAK